MSENVKDSRTTAPKKNVLGRGLAALIGEADDHVVHLVEQTAGSVNEIPLEDIEINSFQPRDHFDEEALQELSASIKVQGIIQPITVRKLNEGKYQIISGERRFRASKMAGLTAVPAYVREANDQQMLEMALIENIQRENLNPIEISLSYQRLISECKIKQEVLGERVGKDRTSVNNYLRLLKLPPDIQVAVRDNKISFGHARALINIEQVDIQLAFFKKIVQESLSVRKTEDLVRQWQINKTSEKHPATESIRSTNPEVKKLQTRLSSHFGTKVLLKADEQNQGEIKIPFYSSEDLSRILEILNI